MTSLGLTADDGSAQVWFVGADGRLSGGAEAVNEAMRYVWWARPLAALYPIPGLKQLENSVYHWVSANRHRLPGGTPQCALNGDR